MVCFPDSPGDFAEMEWGSGGKRVYSVPLILQNPLGLMGSDRLLSKSLPESEPKVR